MAGVVCKDRGRNGRPGEVSPVVNQPEKHGFKEAPMNDHVPKIPATGAERMRIARALHLAALAAWDGKLGDMRAHVRMAEELAARLEAFCEPAPTASQRGSP